MKIPLLAASLLVCTALPGAAQTAAAPAAKPDACKGNYETRDEILAAAPEQDRFWTQTLAGYGVASVDGAWREELPNNAGVIPARGTTLKAALADYCATRAKAAAAGLTPQQYLAKKAAQERQAEDARRLAVAKRNMAAHLDGSTTTQDTPSAQCNPQYCATAKDCRMAGMDEGAADTHCKMAFNSTAHCLCP